MRKVTAFFVLLSSSLLLLLHGAHSEHPSCGYVQNIPNTIERDENKNQKVASLLLLQNETVLEKDRMEFCVGVYNVCRNNTSLKNTIEKCHGNVNGKINLISHSSISKIISDGIFEHVLKKASDNYPVKSFFIVKSTTERRRRRFSRRREMTRRVNINRRLKRSLRNTWRVTGISGRKSSRERRAYILAQTQTSRRNVRRQISRRTDIQRGTHFSRSVRNRFRRSRRQMRMVEFLNPMTQNSRRSTASRRHNNASRDRRRHRLDTAVRRSSVNRFSRQMRVTKDGEASTGTSLITSSQRRVVRYGAGLSYRKIGFAQRHRRYSGRGGRRNARLQTKEIDSDEIRRYISAVHLTEIPLRKVVRRTRNRRRQLSIRSNFMFSRKSESTRQSNRVRISRNRRVAYSLCEIKNDSQLQDKSATVYDNFFPRFNEQGSSCGRKVRSRRKRRASKIARKVGRNIRQIRRSGASILRIRNVKSIIQEWNAPEVQLPTLARKRDRRYRSVLDNTRHRFVRRSRKTRTSTTKDFVNQFKEKEKDFTQSSIYLEQFDHNISPCSSNSKDKADINISFTNGILQTFLSVLPTAYLPVYEKSNETTTSGTLHTLFTLPVVGHTRTELQYITADLKSDATPKMSSGFEATERLVTPNGISQSVILGVVGCLGLRRSIKSV